MAWGEANPQLIELVQSLHRITGLKFVIYNASRQILASEPPTMCTFCTEIRKSPVLAQRCLVCDAAGFDRCDRTGQPCTYHCHMNVQEMIAPIRDKQYRIGYVMIGQFLDYDDRTELHRRAADAAAQFGLDRARLDRGAEELQRYDEAYLRSVMQLLEMSASYIWMNQILDVSRDSLSYNLSCYIQEHLADPLSVAGLSRTFGLSSSAPEPMLAAALDAVRAYLASPDPDAAWVPGAHLEGPFINPVKCGAQPPEWISAPDASMLDRLSPDGLVRLMAIAPEMDGAMDCIRALRGRCTLSVGHTAADYDTACAAIAAGASSATHLFNGMADAAHRAPGVPGAVFDHPDATAELICDGLHVHPTVVRAAFRLLRGRIALISDSLNLAGRPEGSRGTDAAGHAITIRGGRCELDSGTIAGSCVTLAECVRRAISFGVPDTEAFAAASITPARIVRLDGETGSLTVGKRADVVVWRGAVPVAVFVGGRRISAQ